MKRRSVLALCALALGACADDAVVTAPPAPQLSLSRASMSAEVNRHLAVFNGNSVPAAFAKRVEALGGAVDLTLAPVGAATVTGLSDAQLAQLRSTPGLQALEADVMFTMEEPSTSIVQSAGEIGTASAENPTTAVFFSLNWHLRQIGAPTAWAAGKLGSPDVRVGVLDTGIDYTYPDLAGRVDLAASRSFLPEIDAIVQALFPGAHPIADLYIHGTHVAATISSNALVAAGVTSQTTLVGLKVCLGFGDRPTSCSGAAIANAIQYGVELGLPILNLSLGGAFLKNENPGLVSVYNRLVNEAHRRGTLLVVAAGNEAMDLDHASNVFAVFCGAPNVICVAATGPSAAVRDGAVYTVLENPDTPASYTNYGRSAVDVAAPGGNGNGFVWAACSRTWVQVVSGTLVAPCFHPTQVTVIGINGTSMATPHVSGLAALLVADGVKNPAQIRARIMQGADDLGEPGTDPFYGKGRINVPATLGL